MEPGSMPIIIIAVLLLISAFFSAAETALVSLPRARLRYMVEEGIKGAKPLEKLINSGKFLTAILIGNNFVNILITSLATSVSAQMFGSSGAALMATTAGVTIILLVFGEVTPKSLAAHYYEKVSLFVVKPITAVTFIFTPFTVCLSKLSEAIIKRSGVQTHPIVTEMELQSLVNAGHEEGVIDKNKSELINNVFEFGRSDAEDIMTPRTDIVALPLDATYKETVKVFREERYSRVPVYKNDIDHIVGILHFKDLLDINPETYSAGEYMRETFFSYESRQTASLLSDMRQRNINLAVILDEYGGTAGIVTIEDLLEEIVGEIYDEYDDAEDEIVSLGKNEYRADGAAKLADFNDAAGTEFESEDYETIGGYVMGIFGKIPAKGDAVKEGGITFLVEDIAKNRIEKLKITLNDNLTE